MRKDWCCHSVERAVKHVFRKYYRSQRRI